MDLEEVQPSHTPRRCRKCGEVTLRGPAGWKANTTCRVCGHDLGSLPSDEPEETPGEEPAEPSPKKKGLIWP